MPLDKKRILTFLGFAFGIAWLSGLVIFLTGGLVDSPEISPGSGVTLAYMLLAFVYMWAPAWAHLLTRLVTREGLGGLNLRPGRKGWRYWMLAWFVPALMTIVGGAVFFLLFPQYFDADLTSTRQVIEASGQVVPENLWLLVVAQTFSAVLIAPILNSLFTFGEEFGWRAYLLPKLMPLGWQKAMLAAGVIWGVWHWPVIAMGHNYGLEYPGAPWLGMLMMVWVTFGLGIFLGWLTLREGSVWPAVIGHAAINGISSLAVLFVKGSPSPLLGPLPVGILGSLGWVALALWLFFKPGFKEAQAAE